MGLRNTIEDTVASRYLQNCDIPVVENPLRPFVIVIFGGTGDLSRRKLLPSLFHLYQEGELPNGFAILGAGRASHSDEEYRNLVRKALREFQEPSAAEPKIEEFLSHLFYWSEGPEAVANFGNLRAKIAVVGGPAAPDRKQVIFYFAVPPGATPGIVSRLKEADLAGGGFQTRIIVEKPFGQNLRSARALNEVLREAFTEDQIYRIDHYLGKETVQNLIFLRFSNSIFEHLWNRRYIDNIQITVAEELGIENRGSFYEQAGVVRDIVQNHLLQIIGLIAMEPPIGFSPDFIRDEKVKVFRAIQPVDEKYADLFMVRGQYASGIINGRSVPAYREEKGIDPNSFAPTFFAGKFYIANWRWAGVPFYVRTGKRMTRRATEVVIQFYQPPLRLFGRSCDTLDPNALVITIQPEEKISLRFGVKYPYSANQIYPIDMNFCYRDVFQTPPFPAYERLLIDCLRGDLTLFVRQDQIEAMWEVVDPIIKRWEEMPPPDFPNYPAGTWGPVEASRLLEREGRSWITI
jgi:glucose-6-phosphate 1-dehydrogenase